MVGVVAIRPLKPYLELWLVCQVTALDATLRCVCEKPVPLLTQVKLKAGVSLQKPDLCASSMGH